MLWDPVRNTFKEIPTPKDMFCAGHAQLPDGRLLVAGGTARYEKLTGDVRRAGGAMLVKNENPDEARILPAGTLFEGSGGRQYRSQVPVLVPRARKIVTDEEDASRKRVMVTASQARVYVEAVAEGEEGVANTADQYRIKGLEGREAQDVYGLAAKLGLDKKDFQGAQGGLRVRSRGRALRARRPHVRGPLVPDAGDAQGRARARRLRPGRHGRDHPGQERDLRPRDPHLVRRAAAVLPHLPRAVPHRRRAAVLLRLQRGLRARRPGPRAGSVGCGEQHLHARARPAGAGHDGDLRLGAAAPPPRTRR
ncbi:hypothetical protein GCM10020000_71710 [Streptomyces olivoverticillatus]